jgi:predicted PolB exonuclease-like 3'-5' exonuclease
MGYNDQYAQAVVIDVETVGSPNVEQLLDPIRPPGNYRDPQKIAVYQMEKLAERINTASLEPDLNEVVALGCLHEGDDAPEVLTRADADESMLLRWFWEQVTGQRLLGFNHLQFDLPTLVRRSQLLGVDYPPINIDRFRSPHIDLMDRLSFQGRIPYRSLAFYCRRFDIACTDDIRGEDIPNLVASQEWTAIKTHCTEDIRKTAKLAARLGWFRLAQEVA